MYHVHRYYILLYGHSQHWIGFSMKITHTHTYHKVVLVSRSYSPAGILLGCFPQWRRSAAKRFVCMDDKVWKPNEQHETLWQAQAPVRELEMSKLQWFLCSLFFGLSSPPTIYVRQIHFRHLTFQVRRAKFFDPNNYLNNTQNNLSFDCTVSTPAHWLLHQ